MDFLRVFIVSNLLDRTVGTSLFKNDIIKRIILIDDNKNVITNKQLNDNEKDKFYNYLKNEKLIIFKKYGVITQSGDQFAYKSGKKNFEEILNKYETEIDNKKYKLTDDSKKSFVKYYNLNRILPHSSGGSKRKTKKNKSKNKK